MILTEEIKIQIKETLKDKKVDIDKLIAYLQNHDLVEADVFEECKSRDDSSFFIDARALFSTPKVRGYYPVPVDIFIKRLPLYYYKADRGHSLRSWIVELLEYRNDTEGNEEGLVEDLYDLLEYFYYEAGVSVSDIIRYPDIQLHREVEKKGKRPFDASVYFEEMEAKHSDIDTYDFLFQWADYLKLSKKLGWSDKFPERFLSMYNNALEMTGQQPIIYGYSSKSTSLNISRQGNYFIIKGHFPCDGLGRPIMKWIGIKVKNVKGITCNCEKSRYGELRIHIKPDSMLYVLDYYDRDGKPADPGEKGAKCYWEQEYAGPLNMIFNNEALKQARTSMGLTQKEVAEAVGASIRTYQKWENGETKPDCQYLLRIMNWLEIEDTQDLITYESIDVEEGAE